MKGDNGRIQSLESEGQVATLDTTFLIYQMKTQAFSSVKVGIDYLQMLCFDNSKHSI